MPGYDTFTSDIPIVTNPRNPFEEGILNIAQILDEYLLIPNQSKQFGLPFLSRVNRGAYMVSPEVWPSCDVRLYSKNGRMPKTREVGTQGVSVKWSLTFRVRYFHAVVADTKVNDIDVARNLYRIADVLEYRNDLHGWTAHLRAEVTDIVQDPSIFALFPDKNFIAGGEITIDVPLIVTRNYYDAGQSQRDMAMPTGARH